MIKGKGRSGARRWIEAFVAMIGLIVAVGVSGCSSAVPQATDGGNSSSSDGGGGPMAASECERLRACILGKLGGERRVEVLKVTEYFDACGGKGNSQLFSKVASSLGTPDAEDLSILNIDERRSCPAE